ncbi:MAG: biopolymer transporter ExbD [Lentimicrobiaceae bacterium]|nr:biopolymer transporter ExbD [Lentimicrobiaceae bacterium]
MARPVGEINAGSMADIAFLLLIFFLVTTTMDVDSGISRILPPPIDPNIKPPDVKERNIFTVLVNRNDRLLVKGKPGSLETLRAEAKEFLSIHIDNELFPEVTFKELPHLGNTPISKGIISLKNDRGTSYDMYIQVQNELAAAVNELRDELSVSKFGVKFKDLVDETKIEAIQKAIPVAISEAEPEDVGGN